MISDYYYSGGAILAIVAIVYLVVLAWGILHYVLTSLSIYTVAKRRGIRAPGLAWVPVVSVWTLGSICDQYDGTRGIKRKWRVVMLTFAIITCAAFFIAAIVWIVKAAGMALSYQRYAYDFDYYSYALPSEFAGAIAASVIFLIVGSVAAVGLSACEMVCLFKFFESCRPNDALKLFLVALLVPFAYPFCLMSSRKYDLGMPQQPQYYAPEQPQYYAPQPAQPQYYAPQPPAPQPPVTDEPTPPYDPYQ